MNRYHDTGIPVWAFLVISAIAMVAFGALRLACTGPHQQRVAEHEAMAWAHALGMQPTAVVCNDNDSDGDGYVSCTLSFGTTTKQIECRGAYSLGHGCREPKLNIRGDR